MGSGDARASLHSHSTVQPREISTHGLRWHSLSGVFTWQMGFVACYRGVTGSEAKPQEQLPTLTCTSGSPHASGRAAAATPSRSAGLRLTLRHTHSAAGTSSSFHPKITGGNPIDPIKQTQLKQWGTPKPPKNRELRELMVLKHLMQPWLTPELLTVSRDQDKPQAPPPTHPRGCCCHQSSFWDKQLCQQTHPEQHT